MHAHHWHDNTHMHAYTLFKHARCYFQNSIRVGNKENMCSSVCVKVVVGCSQVNHLPHREQVIVVMKEHML